jgi:flagellar biosynthesis protein FlhG
MYFNMAAQDIVVVVTPEPTSITDAYALMKVLCTKYDEKHFKVIMNNVAHATEAKEAFRRLHVVAERFLNVSIDYLGFILHDMSFSQAVRQQKALLDIYPSSIAAPGFRNLARQLLATPGQPTRKAGSIFLATTPGTTETPRAGTRWALTRWYTRSGNEREAAMSTIPQPPCAQGATH